MYSTKLGQLTPGCELKAVDHLCLFCIRQMMMQRYGSQPEIGAVFWHTHLEHEYYRYYASFYTREEIRVVASATLPDDGYVVRLERTMQRLVPWLQKRGVRRTCPHSGKSLMCCSETCVIGTEQIPLQHA